jgi:putative membrane-bound dehydrogenase-like protein
MHRARPLALTLLLAAATTALAADGNRLAYLDECDPYYVSRRFPKLVTPQWVGEPGVEAVVILAIDDMRGHEKWEAFLRPILNRLKRIDGRAPVSIMTCQIDPKDPHLQTWLKEGLSLEVHTIDHPCPFWKSGSFEQAKSTYDRCVDLLSEVPGNKPVAFRMPCCDSLNTPSPRFFAEIFNKTTPKGNYLSIDSSVFHVFTSNDPELPRELVIDPDGQDKFLKYLPRDRSFVNYVEDYPYPYVIDRLCWEFPCMTPSDWQAQHLHKPAHPLTLRDWKAALDATVVKQGVFTMVFHPYGWSTPEQIMDLIDHAVAKHGKKVKFLTFREALSRLERNVLGGGSLRNRKAAGSNAIMFDFDMTRHPRLDGQPVGIFGTANGTEVLLWTKQGNLVRQPFTLPPGAQLGELGVDRGLRFVDLDGDGNDDVIFSNEREYGVYLFADFKTGWSRKVMAGRAGEPGALPPFALNGTNNGAWFHSRSLWVSNETTPLLQDHVDRRSFNQLLENVEPTAKSPEASLRSIQTRPGFQVELVAAEPLVQDPIAFAWGPDGKLWVVEMGDYPLGIDGKGKHGGKVKFLESTKGDGKYDKATVFLDNLGFPTGVMPWRKGVIVTCAPEIFYAEDTDGDGKADKRVTLYRGFVEGNQQHRVNGPVWGLDNWVYVANGDSGGTIRSEKTGATVNIRGHDLRIRPDTGELEATTGQTQYGRCQDDWGNWFGGNNSNPVWHFALDDHYLRRNPHVAAPDPRVPVSVTPGAAPVYPISRTIQRFNDFNAANHFTSACSPIVYRDDLFGPHFAGNTFVSEPVHNLVHREVMTPSGFTFTSRRFLDEQKSEFLASSDNWFRPTLVRTGPDGALWVADMYRHVIEHPEWIPKDWQRKLDLRAGHDKGRIYRVYPVGTTPRPIPRLDQLDTAGLVAALDSPSGWQRDLAQQMLLWRADRAAVPLLAMMAAGSNRPLARLHAFCTLGGLGALEPSLLRQALGDAHPGVRRHAVRLCEPLFARSPELGPAVAKLVDDADAQVRIQVAYSLGEWNDPRAGEALGRLALRDGQDRYLMAAVLSSVRPATLPALTETVVDAFKRGTPPVALLDAVLRVSAGFGDKKTLLTLCDVLAPAQTDAVADWQLQVLAGLLDALEARNTPLSRLWQNDDGTLRTALKRLDRLFAVARRRAKDAQATPADRALGVHLLGRGVERQPEDVATLADLLAPQNAAELRREAVSALGRRGDTELATTLLQPWKSYGPELRTQVLEVLCRRDAWVRILLDAVERKDVLPAEIEPARRQFLLTHRNLGFRQRAAKLLAQSIDPDRQKVVEAYQSVLGLKGDVTRGATIFAKTCATCHRHNGVGNQVGPDIGSVGDKSPEGLLIAILDPNRAVEARYVNYVAQTKNGLTLTGVLTSETATNITLTGPDGKQQVILRTDLEELVSTGKSAMPEGLEKDLKPQDLADLIAHLRSGLPQPERRVFPGNKPEVIRAEADGSLRLPARAAEIYGTNVQLEEKYGNLGFWRGQDDHAVWTVEGPRAGTYEVWLDWACADDAAGNAFVVQAGLQQLTGKVEGTGSWDNYRQASVGQLKLPAGQQRVTLRSVGRVRGYLIDLRSIKFVPVEK